jgi:hypothetical protein
MYQAVMGAIITLVALGILTVVFAAGYMFGEGSVRQQAIEKGHAEMVGSGVKTFQWDDPNDGGE